MKMTPREIHQLLTLFKKWDWKGYQREIIKNLVTDFWLSFKDGEEAYDRFCEFYNAGFQEHPEKTTEQIRELAYEKLLQEHEKA